MFKFIELYSMI
jgi:cation-transporting P-type ATPase 13A2